MAQAMVVDGEDFVGGQYEMAMPRNLYLWRHDFDRRQSGAQGNDYGSTGATGDVVVLDGDEKGNVGPPATRIGVNVVLRHVLDALEFAAG